MQRMDVLVLSNGNQSSEWRTNPSFYRLVKWHLMEHHCRHPIEKISRSVVAHWSRLHGGRFFQRLASGRLKELLDVSDKIRIVSGIIAKLVRHDFMPVPLCASSSVMDMESLFLEDHRALPSIECLDDCSSLRSIPEDMFDEPISPFHPPSSNVLDTCSIPYSVSFTSQCPDKDTALLENQDFSYISDRKRDASPCTSALETRTLSGPLRKRFRKEKYDASTSSFSAAKEKAIGRLAKSIHYTNNDVVFAGAAALHHKGNVTLTEWIKRLCKNSIETSPEASACYIYHIWSDLEAKFLEPKTNCIDGTTVWVQLDQKVVIERISCLLQILVKTPKAAIDPSKPNHENDLDVLSKACFLQKVQTVDIISIDVENCHVCADAKSIMVHSTGPIAALAISDVILGERTSHAGNLKFLHHVDDHIARFEMRNITVGCRLKLVRGLLASWSKIHEGKARFLSSNRGRDSVLTFSFVKDELVIFHGVVQMIRKVIHPIPIVTQPCHDIFLGDCWTFQRARKPHIAYLSAMMRKLDSFGKVVTTTHSWKERNDAEHLIAKSVVKKALRANTKFKCFENNGNKWKIISMKEAILRTQISMRLKAYFGGDSPKIFDMLGVQDPTASSTNNDEKNIIEEVSLNRDELRKNYGNDKVKNRVPNTGPIPPHTSSSGRVSQPRSPVSMSSRKDQVPIETKSHVVLSPLMYPPPQQSQHNACPPLSPSSSDKVLHLRPQSGAPQKNRSNHAMPDLTVSGYQEAVLIISPVRTSSQPDIPCSNLPIMKRDFSSSDYD